MGEVDFNRPQFASLPAKISRKQDNDTYEADNQTPNFTKQEEQQPNDTPQIDNEIETYRNLVDVNQFEMLNFSNQ